MSTLFPAHAGVFPLARVGRNNEYTLPRARGGISEVPAGYARIGGSSPRTRGYFRWQECASRI